VLSRDIASLGIYPSVDPLDSTSRQVDPHVIGEEHYNTTRGVQSVLQRYKELPRHHRDSGHGRALARGQARGLRGRGRSSASCRSRSPFAEVFTGSPGQYVSLKDTIKGFKMIVDGECDALPEQAFYMVGTIGAGVREGERRCNDQARRAR
jgi:F-type H+-transporting ATPase subunit beta